MADRLRLLRRAALVALIPFLRGGVGGTALAAGSAGQAVTNQASASHDVAGASAGTLSNSTLLSVAPVSGLAASPDDAVISGFVPPVAAVVRLFTVTNRANRDDSFRITAASISPPGLLTGLFFDLNGNGVLDPSDPAVTVGTSASPPLPPGGSLGVLARYSAAGLAAGTAVTLALTAESLAPGAVNGLSADDATIRDQVGGGAVFSDPASPGQPPAKTVNGQARINATRGQEVLFAIAFANSGTSPADNAIFSDPLPAGLVFVAGSLTLDGSPLTDAADSDAGEFAAGAVTVRFSAVAPGESHRVEFRARIDGTVPSGVLLSNAALLSADGVAAAATSSARVLVDPFGLLFRAGDGSVVAGAAVSLLADPVTGALCSLPPTAGAGATPNLDNLNPFLSDGAGRYSFLLDPAAAGPPGSAGSCFLRVARTGFLPRLVRIDWLAAAGSSATAPVYTLTLTAQDNLPLASPGSFALTPGPVALPDVSAVGFNLPLFPASALTLTKTADRSHARVGETVGYRVQIHNAGLLPVTAITLTDTLPEFLDLVEGASRRLQAGAVTRIESLQAGRVLTFALGDLAPGEEVEISYRARIAPGAPAAALFNRAAAAGTLPGGAPTAAGPVRAVVFVKQGIFSFQQVLVGRVFEDLDANGRFDSGDRPLPGVRLVLDDGMSVTTDSQGLYNLPSVPEGARMIGLDPATYPPGYCPAPGQFLGDGGPLRLLRTPLRGGALLKQNFILARRDDCPARRAAAATAADLSASRAPDPATAEAAVPALTAGTHVSEQTEALPPVALGALQVLEPAEGAVAMTGALDLAVRTHRAGTVRVAVNDRLVESDRIGQTDLDDRNQLATFHYVGIPILAGPNRISLDALRADGEAGEHRDLTVFGRGGVEKIRIAAERQSLPADGRSATAIRVDLLDAWDHPALDARVRIRTSAGRLAGAAEGGPGDRDLAVASRDGVARATLSADPATGTARLRAEYGDLADETSVAFLPEDRPALLVGIAEATLGAVHADPGVGKDAGTPEDGTHGRVAFFYKGPAPAGALLTAAYDSDRRLNRSTDSNRLFDLDPLEQIYPVMGDSSTRFQEAASNSRGFLKLEKDRSFLLYGDFDPRMDETQLAGYGRKLTGIDLNLEDAAGSRANLSVARPENAFARELIPAAGISGLYRLAHTPIVPGSETVTLEIHDRRNPEAILSSQPLQRGADYDLDPLTGALLFKRPIDSFAGDFDLTEIVVLYEYQTTGFEALSWTGRGRKRWNGGSTQLGFSAMGERQQGGEDFRLFATDLLQRLPNAGTLSVEAARSDGRPLNQGNASLGSDPAAAGSALRVELAQKIAALKGPVRLLFLDVDADFLNPFGPSVAPGTRRLALSADPTLSRRFKLSALFQDEKNQTAAVDNSRTTGSLKLTGQMNDQFEFLGGLDHRDFDDRLSDQRVGSDLLTAGFTLRPTPRIRLSLRREQNVSSQSDPSYPDSTFLSAGFQATEDLKYFLKLRDSSRPIEAIADVGAAGLNPPRSRSELQIGAESRLGTYSTLTSRYQVENGISGTDSFAVLGLGARLPVNDKLAADFRSEAGVHVAGPGDSFESFSSGLSWLPQERLRTTFRYELRNADGFGQTVSAGAVGKPGDDVTLLARLEASDASQAGRDTTVVNFLGGLALRPLQRDDVGLLFSWNRRDRRQGGSGPGDEVRTLSDTLSADSVFELTARARFFAKGALTFSTDQPEGLPAVATTTTLMQARLEYRIGRRWDVAGEARDVTLWQERLRRDSFGLEWGVWATEDFRIGLGYGFTSSRGIQGDDESIKRGFYLNLATKMNKILDLLRREP